MLDNQIFRSALLAGKARRMMRRTGQASGHPLWTKQEDALLRETYPNYKLAKRKLKGRTYGAIKYRASALGIQRRRHIWLGSEISRLRKLYQTRPMAEIMSAFPFATITQLQKTASQHDIKRARKRYSDTQHPVINAIRTRCFEIGYTMPDLDSEAQTGKYYQRKQWQNSKVVYGRQLLKAIYALGGSIKIDWGENHP